jgi:hypothetical protein
VEKELEKLKYPIGKFEKPDQLSSEILKSCIDRIEKFPSLLKPEVINLSGEQLDTVYRPGGWSIRQVVHHCADSHMSACNRFKLALTEDNPIIKPYREGLFAELADSKLARIHPSLEILEGLHSRWASLLRSLSEKDFERTYYHPEYNRTYTLGEATGLYAWHGEHHLAHITALKENRGWK